MTVTARETRDPVVLVLPDPFLAALDGTTVRALAARSGLSPSTVGWVIAAARGTTTNPHNRGQVGLSKARALARALGQPVGALFVNPTSDPIGGS